MNKLREWANLVAGEVLTEAQDYTAMFGAMINAINAADKDNPNYDITKLKGTANEMVSWAKTNLKKNDRIVWYLKYARFAWANTLSTFSEPHMVDERFLQLRNKYLSELSNRQPDMEHFNASSLANLKEKLQHALSYPYPPIQNYVFDKQSLHQLFSDMTNLEHDYQESKRQVIDHDEDDKPVIKFNDGWAWVLLDRQYCRVEGDAMGHCGNTGSPKGGDRILSLRKKIVEDGVAKWRPSLTFILNKNGYLGEMKGRNNNKPEERYHPYILKLLESDMIKGVVGGGYKPENNFQLSDLTDEQQEELYTKKPALAPISWQYKKNGITEDLIKTAENFMVANGYDNFEFDMGKKFVKMEEFNNWQDLIEEYGDKDFKWYAKHIEDGDAFDSYSDNGAEKSSKVDILDMVNKKQPDVIARLRAYIAEEYPDAVEFWEEQNEDEWANASTDDMIDILDEERDQIDNELNIAVSWGESSGAERECLDSMESALSGAVVDTQEVPSLSVMILWDNGSNEFAYDTKVWMGTSFKEFFDNIGEIEDAMENSYESNIFKPEEIKLDVPYYGYSGYDEAHAVDSFLDNNSIPAPVKAEKEEA